jgi:hypothetical protein
MEPEKVLRLSKFFDHPGLMWNIDGSFEILHADWPVYPPGHGWLKALEVLGSYPKDTIFMEIDSIDLCKLFIVSRNEKIEDVYNEKHFHIAIWDEDLLELSQQQMITGVDVEEDEIFGYKKKVVIIAEGIKLTEVGYQRLLDFNWNNPEVLLHEISKRVKPIIGIAYYDTAVREANIIIEMRLCDITGSNSYGQKLINEYYNLLCSRNGGQSSALLKVLRSELRSLFKFVRNDYAHNLKQIGIKECHAILQRASRVLYTIDILEERE